MLARVSIPFSAYSRIVLTVLSAALALTIGLSLMDASPASANLADVISPSTAGTVQVPAAVNVQAAKAAAATAFSAAQRTAAAHRAHLAHQAKLAAERAAAARKAAEKAAAEAAARAAAAKPAPAVIAVSAAVPASSPSSSPQASTPYPSGVLTAAEVGQLWLGAGGPPSAEAQAVRIAYCESGFNPRAYNTSGATGLWQILGSVVPGDLTNPVVNAANAVAKFRASGNTFAQWVCT